MRFKKKLQKLTLIPLGLMLVACPSVLSDESPQLKATVQMNDSMAPELSDNTSSIKTNSVPNDTALVPVQKSVDTQEKIKPLDPVLWPGNYFDKEVATALLKDNTVPSSTWKKIPPWQAGRWESKQATNTRGIKYVHGQPVALNTLGVYTCKMAETSGWQRDKTGGIWDRFESNYWTETDYDDLKALVYVKFRVPGTDEYPDSYHESISFDIDKKTNKITDVQQRKTWTKVSFVAPGIIKQDSVHTIYNESGEPEKSAWNTILCKRVGPFTALGSTYKATSEQMHQDFVNYLKSNGMSNLICNGAESLSDDDLLSIIKSKGTKQAISKSHHPVKKISYAQKKTSGQPVNSNHQQISANGNYR